MARLARIVIPGLPHHVTQRGNGGARTFFNDADYAYYRDLLVEACWVANVEIWAWVLMPNHVHLILTPADDDGLRYALATVHRRYAGRIHERRHQTGHFWRGRFGAVVMDETYLGVALGYGALNPVRARLVKRPEDWSWSSTRAHLTDMPDGVTSLAPIQARFPHFAGLLEPGLQGPSFDRLRQAESIGRPLGDDAFIAGLEARTGRILKPAKRGPKPVCDHDQLTGS